MENYLTGIALFEQGSYVRYSNRVHIPASKYVTGYGWGILTEGYLDGNLPHGDANHPGYLHTASSSDPLTINAWDATGSQVSDLNGYITSSYWGTRLKGTDAYEWYPVLAKDKVNGKAFDRPLPIEKDGEGNWQLMKDGDYTSQSTLKAWRVYVKTGDDDENLRYRTVSGIRSAYNNRKIQLKDYEFAFQMLLTEQSKVTRGTELATDTSYGFKGGNAFFRRTKNMTNEDEIDKLWNDMKASGELGIRSGTDANGSYLDFEFLSPVNQFYAMYYLSSSLYSPIPRQFLKDLGGTYMQGAQLYGTFSNNTQITDNCLCVGPFYLEYWAKNQEILFARNNDWFEVGLTRYRIPGVKINIYSEATQRDDALFDLFNAGQLDYTNIPQSKMKELKETDKKNIGESTFKLNVNSCTQERWNELFGDNGSIIPGKDNDYKVKPWMSNKNFLDGIYWSINREAFANARGVTPSFNYFADAYMSDGENGISYNSTDAHKNAVANFHDVINGKDNYGYNYDKAVLYFKNAVKELMASGDIVEGQEITIDIEWMYQSDTREYGDEIAGYITKAFNDSSVSNGSVKLKINQAAVAQWDQVYNDYLMVGKYDLAFGAISGNSLNPLNFMEVLKSDNSSGFTLNWGADTGKVDELNPIIYNGKAWSYDALWEAGDHGSVVKGGRSVDPVDHGYMSAQAGASNDLYNGGTGATLEIPFEFVDVDGAELSIDYVRLYFLNAVSVDPEYTYDEVNKKIIINISPEEGDEWNNNLVVGNKLDEKAEKESDPETKFNLLHPFTRDKYNIYWSVEVHYSLQIVGSVPGENVYYISANKSEDEALHA